MNENSGGLDDLLEATSRTFALTIPYLPEPTRREVTVAYLLFRIADTLEDSDLWPRERRARELLGFRELLEDGSAAEARLFSTRMREDPPTQHGGYLKLLSRSPAVFAALASFPRPVRQAIVHHTAVTAAGMAENLARARAGVLQLSSIDELRAYCYLVAGIVGELLGEIFVLDWPVLRSTAQALRRDARAFGEGLQLTNILKDAADDAREGRNFLPLGFPREAVFALARADLATARRYVATLQAASAPDGIVAFAALPLRLAISTLDTVEKRGPGAKLSRAEVVSAAQVINEALAAGSLGALLAGPFLTALSGTFP